MFQAEHEHYLVQLEEHVEKKSLEAAESHTEKKVSKTEYSPPANYEGSRNSH